MTDGGHAHQMSGHSQIGFICGYQPLGTTPASLPDFSSRQLIIILSTLFIVFKFSNTLYISCLKGLEYVINSIMLC